MRSLLTILIRIVHLCLDMFNKISCRGCGTYLTPSATCNICQEYVSWICGKCNRIEDCVHTHNYCRVSLRRRLELELGLMDLAGFEGLINK